MSYVKLDTGILNSTLWIDREAREIFITALLMAVPKSIGPTPQIEARSLNPTGWVVPAGEYGFVPAAGPGICRQAGLDLTAGLAALERLGSIDLESRSAAFEGRRLVRIDGGYLVLNYMTYRDKDHTAAARQKRYRERNAVTSQSNAVTESRHAVTPRHVTQADADADKTPQEQPPPKVDIPSHPRAVESAGQGAPPERLHALRGICIASRVTADASAMPHIRQWAAEGVTDTQLQDAIAIAREAKPHPEMIPIRYLLPIVARVCAGAAAPASLTNAEMAARVIARIEAKEAANAAR